MIEGPLIPGDRNVKWLSECNENWKYKPLKYICKINNRTLSENTDPDLEFEYIDISSVNSEGKIIHKEKMKYIDSPSRARRILSSGDVIISTVRTYLKAITFIDKIDGSIICSTGFAVISPGKTVIPEFLAYWVRSTYFIDEIVARSVGVSYPAINSTEIGSLPFPLLRLDKQKEIADFLDRETGRVDQLIEKKVRQIELLQEKRAALIGQAVTRGLDPTVKTKDPHIPWLGPIPSHWEISQLKYILKAKGNAIKTGPFGSQLLSAEMISGTIKVYNQRNVLDNNFKEGDDYITEEKYRDLNAFTIDPGDLLITTRGTIGRCALFPEDAELGILHPCLMRIQVDEKKVLSEYLSVLIQDGSIVRLQLILMSNATTIDVIYSDSLKKVILPIPPINEQINIIDFVRKETGKIDRLIGRIGESVERLGEYRGALISAAVTGKIDVRE